MIDKYPQYFYKTDKEYSALDVILAVHLLHSRGYEQLRLLPGLSPSGCSWRWHIYPKCLLKGSSRMEKYPDPFACSCISGSTAIDTLHDGAYKVLANDFEQKYADFMMLAKGDDLEYVKWFEEIVNAAHNNSFAVAYADWPFDHDGWELGDGSFINYPPLTPFNLYEQDDDFVINYALHAMGKYSRSELDSVLHSKWSNLSKHEIADTIKRAIKSHKGLLAIIVTGQMQATRYQDDIFAEKEIPDGWQITLNDKTQLTLMDRMELIPWSPK